jgi:hypothetical protein
MTTLKPQPAHADVLAALAWAAVALTPVGWFYGVLAIAYSHLGDVTDIGMTTTGVCAVRRRSRERVHPGRLRGTCRAPVRQDRRDHVRAAAPGHDCRHVAVRRVDRRSRGRGGRGAGFRLGALPPQAAAARAGRCAARGGIACGYRTARRIWPDFVSSPSLAPSSLARHVPSARHGISARSRSTPSS